MTSKTVFVVMVLLTSVAQLAHGDQNTAIRLAIVDVDHEKAVPSAFQDILFIELSKHSEIILLEREEIELILKEQVLNLSLTGDLDASTIVRSGQILAADVILMLKNEGDANDQIDLRLRLVDARHGLKLLDSNQYIDSKPADYEVKARLISASVLQHIKRISVEPDELLSIGVSTFKSEEMAKRWDWLSDVIPTNIEQNLALYPSVYLMERTVTKPLIEEREASSGLPESITSSSILLDGAYRIDITNNTIFLFIRAKRDGQNLFDITIEGSLNTIEQLCEKAARTVMEKVRSRPIQKSMDTSIEAQMLCAEARTYLGRQEYYRALRPAESAYALMPQELEYSELIIRALMGSVLRAQAMGGKEQTRLTKTRYRVLNLAERIIRTCPLPSDKNLIKGPDQDREYLLMHSYAMEKGSVVMSYFNYKLKDDDRYKGLYEEFGRNLWDFYEMCHDRYAGKSHRLHARLLYHQSWSLNRIKNFDECLRKANEILGYQGELNFDLYAIRGFVNAFKANWQDDTEAFKKTENFLAIHQKSPDSEVRLEALDYGMKFYTEISLNHEQIRRLAREYAEFCIIAGVPNPKPILKKAFFPDEQASEIFELELLQDIIDFSLEKYEARENGKYWYGIIRRADGTYLIRNFGSLSVGTIRLADLLEKQGRAAEAITYLQKMMVVFDKPRSGGWIGLKEKIIEIKGKHPEIEIAEAFSASEEFNPVLVFSLKDKALNNNDFKDIYFRRVCVDNEQVIIVISEKYSEHYGVLRLDRKNLRLLNVQFFEAVEDFRATLTNDYDEYGLGPALTIYNGDVYLGFMHAGFLVFKNDGTTMRLNEENGLVYNRIRKLECLGDKIFAHVGLSWGRESGLMELDLRTGLSKIITSTRVEKAKCELDHGRVVSIAPDPRRGVLWVLSWNFVDPGRDWSHLYRYDPKKGDFQRVSTPELTMFLRRTNYSENIHCLRIFGDSLLIFIGRGICEFNIPSQQTTTLAYNHGYGDAKWNFPWMMHSTTYSTLVEKGLVCKSYNKLLYFQDGKKEPVYITNESFKEWNSSSLYIRDLVPTEEGLYVLFSNGLYLISNIKSCSRPDLTNQHFSPAVLRKN